MLSDEAADLRSRDDQDGDEETLRRRDEPACESEGREGQNQEPTEEGTSGQEADDDGDEGSEPAFDLSSKLMTFEIVRGFKEFGAKCVAISPVALQPLGLTKGGKVTVSCQESGKSATFAFRSTFANSSNCH